MPLQNRVTPFGDVVAVPGRGLLMGNRGILHDGERRIVRYAVGRRWIACVTRFRNRRRQVMRPGSYTELFFLDEVTAFAAGHRPCAECRHADYQRFRAAWPASQSGGKTSADTIDRRLHEDRLVRPRVKRTHTTEIPSLPDGSFVDIDGVPWLVQGDDLLRWSDAGYAERRARPRSGVVTVLTPRSLVAVISAGYHPLVHPSASQAQR